MDGYIKLHRKLLESAVFDNPMLLKIWLREGARISELELWQEYNRRKNSLGWMDDAAEYDRRCNEILDDLGL